MFPKVSMDKIMNRQSWFTSIVKIGTEEVVGKAQIIIFESGGELACPAIFGDKKTARKLYNLRHEYKSVRGLEDALEKRGLELL